MQPSYNKKMMVGRRRKKTLIMYMNINLRFNLTNTIFIITKKIK